MRRSTPGSCSCLGPACYRYPVVWLPSWPPSWPSVSPETALSEVLWSPAGGKGGGGLRPDGEGLVEDRAELLAVPLEEGEAVLGAARLGRAEAHDAGETSGVGAGEGVRAHGRAGEGAERADRDENSRIRPRFRLVGEKGVILGALLRVRVERAVHACAGHFYFRC